MRGRRLDEVPRPHLVGAPADPRDRFEVDLDDPDFSSLHLPGAQHVALWLRARDLFARRSAAIDALDARLAVDPYAMLDVVLAPEREFPLDLLDALRARLAAAPRSYASRALAHRGEDLQRRLCIVLGGDASPGWVDAVRERAPVFRDQGFRQALADAERLGGDLPGARITDEPPPDAFRELQRRAGPDSVCFAHRSLESAWQRDALG